MQIEDRNYAAAVKTEAVKRIFAWGIAFWHRRCSVAFKEITGLN